MNTNTIAHQGTSAQYEASQFFQQLELFSLHPKRQKAQISSIPGASPKNRHRYRVTLGDRILGDRLTLDEALELARRGTR